MWVGLATVLVVISLALSFMAITRHLLNYTKPYLQRYIVRILLMVPIYSLNAWLAMIYPSSGIYLDSLRECYEAFVIYSFMKYLLNFLQYDTNLQQYIEYKPGPSNIFPLCCLPACVGGKLLLLRCKHGILQYVVIRPVTSIIAFISQKLDIYGENDFNPLSGNSYPILLVINNASQVMAMYCLIIFYTGYSQELRPMKPLGKFFSIKLVVFFSFFQSVLISILIRIYPIGEFLRDLFPEIKEGHDRDLLVARKLQELLICIDMLLASIAHQFAFPHWPFVEDDDDNCQFITEDHNNGQSREDLGPSFDSRSNINASIISMPQPQQQQHPNIGNQSDYYSQSSSRPMAGNNASLEANSLEQSTRTYSSITRPPTTSYREALVNLLDFTDERSDMNEHFVQIFGRFRGLFRRGLNTLPRVEMVQDKDQPTQQGLPIDAVAASRVGRRKSEGEITAPGSPPAASYSPTRRRLSSGTSYGSTEQNLVKQTINNETEINWNLDPKMTRMGLAWHWSRFQMPK